MKQQATFQLDSILQFLSSFFYLYLLSSIHFFIMIQLTFNETFYIFLLLLLQDYKICSLKSRSFHYNNFHLHLIIITTFPMAPVSTGKQRMNQFLQDRRKKINQNKNFRKQRIIKHYRKALTSYDQQLNNKFTLNQPTTTNTQPQPQKQLNPQIQRKINFYNSIFTEPHVNQRLNKKNKNKLSKNNSEHRSARQNLPKDQKTLIQEKLDSLKEKKVKFIKKMGKQKTSKGQPVMRNMISYALTKIQETIHKEKLQKIVSEETAKKQPQKGNNNEQNDKMENSGEGNRNQNKNNNHNHMQFNKQSHNQGNRPNYHKNNNSNNKWGRN